jgi:leucyl aminopeptidase
MTIEFVVADQVPAEVGILGVPVYADLTVPAGTGAGLDTGFLTRSGFEGKPGQALAFAAPDGSTIVALGVGPADSVDGDALRRAGAALARQAAHVEVAATTLAAAAPQPGLVAAAVEGIGLGAYRYTGHKSKPKPAVLRQVVVVGGAEGDVRRGAIAAQATCRARDWVNEPPHHMTPSRLAEIAGELAEGSGLSLRVWDEAQILAEGLGGLAGVAAGAQEPARLIRLAWEPVAASRTVALVGKGITFDSGGLSLKPPAGMMTMKDDMGGAAAVIATVAAAADLDLPVKVVGWVAATENMPSGTATRPGDVLVARNGTSIEVLNTDAEGRLVLADGLSLAVEETPDAVIDIATLTGAQRVALGTGVAAVLGNDDDLIARIIAAGEAAGEPYWRLPLVASYRRHLDSDVADIKNVAATPAAGTIMAALFLQEFVGDATWAHLDIATPAWSETEEGWLSKGGTGWGARTLIELLRAYTD